MDDAIPDDPTLNDNFPILDAHEKQIIQENIDKLQMKIAFIDRETTLLRKRRFPECQDSLNEAIGISSDR